MNIQQNQTSFGQSYRIHTKTKEDADTMEMYLKTHYNIERKENSKKMLLTPKKEYLGFMKTAEDIAAARFPNRYEDEEKGSKFDIMSEWARRKVQNDIMETIMSKERSKAIDIEV